MIRVMQMINARNDQTLNNLASKDEPNIGSMLPRRRVLMSIMILLVVGIGLNLTQVDLAVSGLFADGQNGFPLRSSWLPERLLHYYAGKLTILLALLVIVFNLIQLIRPNHSRDIIVAGRYVLFSWLASYAAVGVLKHTSTLPCPWDLTAFGGSSVYLGLDKLYSSAYPVGHCFPAGHATGAYGLLCLGFVLLLFGKPMRAAVIPVMILGSAYSLAQLVRGAHFLSHDFFSVAICLFFSWMLAEFYLIPNLGLNPLFRTPKEN